MILIIVLVKPRSTILRPSTAALTIPPAYPAPSPIGNNPFILMDCPFISLVILTGAEVRVSGAIRFTFFDIK